MSSSISAPERLLADVAVPPKDDATPLSFGRLGLPNPFQLAVMAQEFRDEVYLAWLPPAVQRALASLLAPAGRLLGYEAVSPRLEH